MEYANSLLVGMPDIHLKRLQRVQNCAARLIYGIPKQEHITPFLKTLHWLPIESRIKFKILLITYKAIKGLTPSYIADLLVPYIPNRWLRIQEQGLLTVPRYKCINIQKEN